MNWTQLLAQGPGDSPGREQAIAKAKARTQARYAECGGPKRAKGSSKTKVTKVKRSQLRNRE